MRLAAAIDVGDIAHVTIGVDPRPCTEPMHPGFARALARNKRAQRTFNALAPSRQKEILRHLNSLKSKDSAARNVAKVIAHLVG